MTGACEIAWFSALCDDDYEFLGVPDPKLKSSWEHCRDIVMQAETGGFDNILLPSGYELGVDTTAFGAAIATWTKAIHLLMAVRIGESWDRTVAASLEDRDPAEVLDGYLADAHALEEQSAALLDRGPKLADVPSLASVLENHHAETNRHREHLERRLSARGSSPSRIKDAALKLGGVNWSGFWAANPDTPVKLAMFAYAVEHLEIGAYEQLTRVARLAGDGETAMVVDQILPEERAAAEFVFGAFDEALDASLPAQRG